MMNLAWDFWIISFLPRIHELYFQRNINLIRNTIAARLERKSFCEEERRTKDWERKADKAAQIIIKKLENHEHYKIYFSFSQVAIAS